MSATPSPARLLAISTCAAALFLPSLALAQTAPATAPSSTSITTIVGSTSITTLPFERFVGTITADRVYVRSGPGSNYYELGQLSKGDLVQVVDGRQGWYRILPPNGTFCMIAKEFVELDPTGAIGTVKKDYINVRAGTALYKNREPSAVLVPIRINTKLTILGATDKYYEIAPPEKAYVFISPQFVKNTGGADYKIPTLKLPAGAVGPAKDTVTSTPTTLPAPTVEITPAPTDTTTTILPATPTENTTNPAQTHTVAVPPQPTTTFSGDAYARFNELNARYQTELQKPVGHRDALEPLTNDYKALSDSSGLPPSIQQGTKTRIAALEKLAAIQRLQQENATSSDAMAAQQRALKEQYAAAEKAIKDYEQTGPYIAEGRLQTSTAVEGKYALVNPATGRVLAYVDPQADVDIASLLGKYIGVRGSSHKPEGTDITIITVRNATLLPTPESLH